MDFSTVTLASSSTLNNSSLISTGIAVPKQTKSNISSPVPSTKVNPEQVVKQVNELFVQRGESLFASFEKDSSTGMNIVKIVDKNTNETISQLPIKEMVGFAQFLEQIQQGKLIHATA